MKKIILSYFLACLSSLLPMTSARAEQSRDFGAYTVHYIAVNSTYLNPTIAARYDIERSERTAFLNISILKNLPDGKTLAVPAEISGLKKNLLQQSAAIDFIEIKEGAAIYYIGLFEFSNAELLKFELEILPQGVNRSFDLKWDTRLYAD